MSIEQLESQSTVEESTLQISSELIKSEELENSPFMITETEDGVFITLGQYRLSPIVKSKQDARNYINSHMWEVMYKMVFIINEHLNK